MRSGRDVWWHDAISGQSLGCEPEWLDAEHPLFLLYTSGSTGKPKGIQHCTAGYLLNAKLTTKWAFDLKDEDVYWCTADVGWVTGHTYVVYGPLAAGATVFMYEGAPTFPDGGRFWKMCQTHGVSIFYTAPTAIRALMKLGDAVPGKVRSAQAAGARQRRRAHQSRGVDVVSPRDRRRALSHRRHVVADRDRRRHDGAHSRRDAHQAGILHQAAPGNFRGHRR